MAVADVGVRLIPKSRSRRAIEASEIDDAGDGDAADATNADNADCRRRLEPWVSGGDWVCGFD